ncbi:MAG: sporulation protein [Firmicutes bacterium]|nr:sporulation protein [Bacillota bacterium]
MDEQNLPPHVLSLSERRRLTMTGVAEVVSFDEQLVVLRTALGELAVQGEGLQLRNLSVSGAQVEVEGKINALSYQEPREKGGLLRRLFG